MELLAPAGDFACLQAALEAGADAVYLGLESLNARRRARNFSPDEFARAVAAAHAKGARVYLTLNIDLSERELGEAARILELARSCKADAVLIRDPALLALKPAFPELEFHLSTQACAASSADIRAAAELGLRRAVLARELSLAEISACSGIPGMGIEVFVQGALCCSVSGRCLLSSWAGGRSGNRGACTSPCRVPWTAAGEPAGTPLSMKDLAAWRSLKELRQAGVSALKIEGRLKNPDWVRRAVSLYRRALSGEAPETLAAEAERLGAVAGREHTSAYLEGKRDDLTGVWGRKKGEAPAEPAEAQADDSYDLDIEVEEKSLSCRCSFCGQARQWSLPKTKVVRQAKAVSLAEVLQDLSEKSVQGLRLGRRRASQPELLLPPRAANALKDRLSVELRLMRKKPDGKVKVELPEQVRKLLAKSAPSPENRLRLGDAPDRLRIEAGQFAAMRGSLPPGGAVVEGLSAEALETVSGHSKSVAAALPPIFFEADIPGLQALLEGCKRHGLSVEVNSLGGWLLAKEAGAAMEGGPGLPVLNSLAAKQLLDMGLRGVTISMEADREQIEEISKACPAPVSLVVYGRPPLMTTRARLRPELLGKDFADRRGIRMRPRLERGLWTFRPVEPFDWRGLRDPDIRAKHLVMDLVGCESPAAEWESSPRKDGSRFNYDRALF
ncbi:MAG: U32 family peptidase [Elusimicrobia bacterium]|nr:U32 family peptidase [Elusimicrobiota bacterium]